MIEIKFTGQTFAELRTSVQEFAVAHLNAKFDVKSDDRQLEFPGVLSRETERDVVAKENATPSPTPQAMPDIGAPTDVAHIAQEPEPIKRKQMGRPKKVKPAKLEVEAAPFAGAPPTETPVEVKAEPLPKVEPTPAPQIVEPEPVKDEPKPEVAKPEPAKPDLSIAPTPPPTIQMVQAALQRFFDKHQMEGCQKLLSEFRAGRLRDLEPADYGRFIQRADDVLSGKD